MYVSSEDDTLKKVYVIVLGEMTVNRTKSKSKAGSRCAGSGMNKCHDGFLLMESGKIQKQNFSCPAAVWPDPGGTHAAWCSLCSGRREARHAAPLP